MAGCSSDLVPRSLLLSQKAKFCVNSKVSVPWDYFDNDSSSDKQKLYGTIKLKLSDYAQVVFDSDGGKANILFTDHIT